MRIHNSGLAAALSVLFVCSVAGVMWLEGQAVTATILGTVTDPSGAAFRARRSA